MSPGQNAIKKRGKKNIFIFEKNGVFFKLFPLYSGDLNYKLSLVQYSDGLDQMIGDQGKKLINQMPFGYINFTIQ